MDNKETETANDEIFTFDVLDCFKDQWRAEKFKLLFYIDIPIYEYNHSMLL